MIVVNFITVVPSMPDSLRCDLEVLCLASHQENAFPTLIGFLLPMPRMPRVAGLGSFTVALTLKWSIVKVR